MSDNPSGHQHRTFRGAGTRGSTGGSAGGRSTSRKGRNASRGGFSHTNHRDGDARWKSGRWEDRTGGGWEDRRADDRRGGDYYREGERRRQTQNPRKHSNRGGAKRSRTFGPQRSGYREERLTKRKNEPALPEGLDPKDLDPTVRQELRSLAKDNADMVAKHLIQAALLVQSDPHQALLHARAAKDRAGRVAVTRETNGIVAYHAGEWKEAISELRAARRMSGGPGLLAVLADAERGLGRPQKALEIAREENLDELDAESRVELAIVLAGAHHDLGDNDSALLTLQEELERDDAPEVSRMRMYYAYADALEIMHRDDEAVEWFQRCVELDTEHLMDATQRIASLRMDTASADGEQLEGKIGTNTATQTSPADKPKMTTPQEHTSAGAHAEASEHNQATASGTKDTE